MNIPHALVVDDCGGNLFVADRESSYIHRFPLLPPLKPPVGSPLSTTGKEGNEGLGRRLAAPSTSMPQVHLTFLGLAWPPLFSGQRFCPATSKVDIKAEGNCGHGRAPTLMSREGTRSVVAGRHQVLLGYALKQYDENSRQNKWVRSLD